MRNCDSRRAEEIRRLQRDDSCPDRIHVGVQWQSKTPRWSLEMQLLFSCNSCAGKGSNYLMKPSCPGIGSALDSDEGSTASRISDADPSVGVRLMVGHRDNLVGVEDPN